MQKTTGAIVPVYKKAVGYEKLVAAYERAAQGPAHG